MSDFLREPGSFRDPASCVFYWQGQVLRSLDSASASIIQQIVESGFLQKLIQAGLLVDSSLLPEDHADHLAMLDRFPDAKRFMRHERIGQISYPYEWSFTMLADAALLHLNLQSRLLGQGLSLKDASAFNVQFKLGQPVFIDAGSIERPRRLDIWYAYGQFCRMFLFPLILNQTRGLSFRQMFMSELDGVQVESAYKLLGALRSLAPRHFIDVYLQNKLVHKQVHDSAKLAWSKQAGKQGNPEVQQINLNRLRKKVDRLVARHDRSSLWSEYDQIRNYSAPAIEAKRELVAGYVEQYQIGRAHV
jgi:hypothetical protein